MGLNSVQKRHESTNRLNPISDQELGIIAETMTRPRAEVAEILGRSSQMVGVMRRMVKNGDPRKGTNRYGTSNWTEEEDEVILSLGDRRMSTAELLRLFPGRSASGIRFRRAKLGKPARLGIGKRTVIAKTCPACGLLLAGDWFGTCADGKASRCRKCAVEAARKNPSSSRDARALERRKKYQKITAELATKHGDEYTDSDMRILGDPLMSDLEKAILLNRTFVAVGNARRNFKLPSSAIRLSELDPGEWAIQFRAGSRPN